MTPDQLRAAADAMSKARDEAHADYGLHWNDSEAVAARMLVRVLIAGLEAAADAAPARGEKTP